MSKAKKDEDIIIVDDNPSADAPEEVVGADELIVDDEEGEGKFTDRCRLEDDHLIVKLNKPFTCRYRRASTETTEETAELRFRRANGGDLRALANFRDEEEKTFRLFLRLSGLVEAQYNKIDYIDLQFCMEAIDHFLLTGPKTGKS